MRYVLILTGILAAIWTIKTLSICKIQDEDESRGLYHLVVNRAPPEWRRFSKVLFFCWLVLFLIFGFALDWR